MEELKKLYLTSPGSEIIRKWGIVALTRKSIKIYYSKELLPPRDLRQILLCEIMLKDVIKVTSTIPLISFRTINIFMIPRSWKSVNKSLPAMMKLFGGMEEADNSFKIFVSMDSKRAIRDFVDNANQLIGK